MGLHFFSQGTIFTLLVGVELIAMAFSSRILIRAGYSGWLALLVLIPVLNLFFLWLFAFSDWPVGSQQNSYSNIINQQTNQTIIWVVWSLIIAISVGAAIVLYALGTWGPDHAVAASRANKLLLEIGLGLTIPVFISICCMLNSKIGLGIIFALLSLPSALGMIYLLK